MAKALRKMNELVGKVDLLLEVAEKETTKLKKPKEKSDRKSTV